MPVVLARLRTGSQIDENLCGINGRLLEDEGVCSLDVFTTNNTSPKKASIKQSSASFNWAMQSTAAQENYWSC